MGQVKSSMLIERGGESVPVVWEVTILRQERSWWIEMADLFMVANIPGRGVLRRCSLIPIEALVVAVALGIAPSSFNNHEVGKVGHARGLQDAQSFSNNHRADAAGRGHHIAAE
jgi:hypothetical protein